MGTKQAEFLKRLKATFRIEADEHVRSLSSGLIELEKSPTAERSAEIMEFVLREAHSLKGAARSVEMKEIESICQPLESAFSALKREAITLSPTLFDLFHQAVDAIGRLLSLGDEECPPADRARFRELAALLGQASVGKVPPASKDVGKATIESKPAQIVRESIPPVEEVMPNRPSAEDSTVSAGTVRIPTARLESLLLQAEELVQVKLSALQRTADLEEINQSLAIWKSESTKWKDRLRTADISKLRDWHEWNEAQLNLLESRATVLANALEQDQRTTRRLVDEHLEEMKKVLMLPVSSLVETLPKVVRDLARDQGKEADLVVRGEAIEIDKRILDELKDPIIHLLRNCIDHGIEKPELRASLGKATRGTIAISFETIDSRQVEILISDDGAGIDVDQVRAAGIKAGALSREAAEKLDEREVLSLIFQSGVSTSRIITDISGRGLGMAIVREKVEKLGGAVSVDSCTNKGSAFRLIVPLALATFRGVLVQVDDHAFVLPTVNVERALRVKRDSIKTVENRDTLNVDGQIIPMVLLGSALNLPLRKKKTSAYEMSSSENSDYLSVVIVAFSDKRLAFQVDEILDEQQAMVKGLGGQLKRVRNISGAAVLGNGRVVPVLNVSDLMKSAVRSAVPLRSEVEEDQSRKGKILVAEDSITSRSLLKNILENAGYEVVTAVDGADAFAKFRIEQFDLVVSDVDMPRMSGFELTAKIRGEKKLSEVPVVLVTALESPEDRERGIDAGANAYIVKSSFDQSNLLEVIHRLL